MARLLSKANDQVELVFDAAVFGDQRFVSCQVILLDRVEDILGRNRKDK